MVLRSYGFMKEVDPRVWGILSEMPKQADCAVELVEASLNNKINLSPSGVADYGFDIGAYGNKANRNRRLCSCSKNYSALHINDGAEESEPCGVSDAEISRAADQGDVYSEVDDADEQAYVVSRLDAMNSFLFVSYHVDFWLCLKLALLGVPESIGRLKSMADDNSYFGGLLRVLLSGKGSAVSMRLANVG